MKSILHLKQVLNIPLNKLFMSAVIILLMNSVMENLNAQCQLQSPATGFNTINSTHWTQSFLAPCDGQLNSITIEVIDETFTTLRIFSGSGCGSTLHTQSISCSAGVNTITLTGSAINLVDNNSYSFQLESASSSATLKHGKVSTYNDGILFTGSACANSLSDLDFTVSLGLVLPVELLNFKATPSVKGNLLTWTTANETNNKGFYIEHSPQPPKGASEKWETLGFVAAKGKAAKYDFLDAAPPLGAGGSYYRLRQIDNDGTETLSKVVSIINKGTGKLNVHPSVTNHYLNIDTEATDDFQVINLLGQVILRGQSTPQIDVSALHAGTYFLKIGDATSKFVKQ